MTGTPPALSLRGLGFAVGATAIVGGVDLEVAPGELLALVGPSGCGKSTLLRLVAGLLRPTSGEVVLDGRTVASPRSAVPPEKRRIGLVFQEHALFPHLDVAANVAFGLRHLPRSQRRAVVDDLLDLVHLAARRDAYPHELSGGEQQRVALARALAPEPAVVLLDEPFASLDPSLRAGLREEVLGVLRERKATAVLVTHDRDEALESGDRVAVMRAGRLEQVGDAVEVFHRPATAFVARFVGEAALLAARSGPGGWQCELGPFTASVAPGVHDDAAVVVRADDVDLTVGGASLVVDRRFHSGNHRYDVRLPSGLRLTVDGGDGEAIAPGTAVSVAIRARHPLPVVAAPVS